MEKRYKTIWVGALIGLLIGILSTFLFEAIQKSIPILFPLGILKSIFNINVLEWMGVSPFFILIHLLSWILVGILFGIIISFVKKKLKENKRIDKIFIGLIILEIIILSISPFLKMPVDVCTRPSFLNPFVLHETFMLPAFHQMNMLFYPIIDLLILTIITYLIYLGINKLKKSKHKK